MPISVECPTCGSKLKAPDSAVGKVRSCPKCAAPVALFRSTDTASKSVSARPPPPPPTSDFAFGQDDDGLPVDSEEELPVLVSSFVRENLMPDEKLVAITRISAFVMVVPSIIAGLGMLMCMTALLKGQDGIGLGVFGLVLAISAGGTVVSLYLKRLTTEFSCTDMRILIKSGFITTRLREMPLPKVEALLMEQGLFGKLFGYGTLVFKGSGGTRRSCDSIESPFAFYRRVQEQVAAAQRGK